jgi:FkbM family methyltransferase
VVVDVGANVGSTVVPSARRVGPQGKVVCFEPHPRIFRCLQENVDVNGLQNVEAHNLAMGGTTGVMAISDVSEDDTNRLVERGSGASIPVARLDDVCRPLPHIDLLKIDVEGYELEVLAGAAETLEKTRHLCIEVSEGNLAQYGHRGQQILDILTEHGFQLFRFVDDRTLQPIRIKAMVLSRYEDVFGARSSETAFAKAGWRQG